MSSMGGSTTTEAKQSIDPFIKGLMEQNVSRLEGIESQAGDAPLYDPILGFNQTQQDSFDIFNRLAGQGGSGMMTGYSQAVGNGSVAVPTLGADYGGMIPNASSESILTANGGIERYMSPYTDSVVDTVLGRQSRNNAIELSGLNQRVANAGGFGGSRHGVAESLTRGEQAMNMGQLEAGLRDQAFSQAAGLATGDAGRNLQAQGMNMQAGAQRAQMGLNRDLANQSAIGRNIDRSLGAEGQYNDTLSRAFGMDMTAASALRDIGNQRQGLEQAQASQPLSQMDLMQLWQSLVSGFPVPISTSQTQSRNPGVLDYITAASQFVEPFKFGG